MSESGRIGMKGDDELFEGSPALTGLSFFELNPPLGGRGRARHDKGLRLPIRSAGSMTGLLNAGMMNSRTVIVMNHEHENDDTGLIEEGGKSSFLLAMYVAAYYIYVSSDITHGDVVMRPVEFTGPEEIGIPVEFDHAAAFDHYNQIAIFLQVRPPPKIDGNGFILRIWPDTVKRYIRCVPFVEKVPLHVKHCNTRTVSRDDDVVSGRCALAVDRYIMQIGGLLVAGEIAQRVDPSQLILLLSGE